MAAAYRIVFVHLDLEEFAKEVKVAVKNAMEGMSGIPNLLKFSTTLSKDRIPQVVAYLASSEGRDSKVVNKLIEAALARDVSIVPIVPGNERESISAKLPKCITHLNAVKWVEQGANVATSLLEMLGLVETERKVFVSYRRSETSELAVQLHTELVQRRFDVFLDRFSVEPGVDFQRRLEEDLGDKAFVLVLESSGLRNSRWVRHEIAYAHARRIEILALTLPDVEPAELVPSIDEAFRLRVDTADIIDEGMLSPSALEITLDAIELAHARALRRRREQILGSVMEKLRNDGCTCSPADDWCVLASGQDGRSGLFWVTPRRPEPKDFHSLSQQQERVMRKGDFKCLQGSVVHESGRVAENHQELLDWISSIAGGELVTVGMCSI